jgi:F-type H+-transporting ATPase subunit delta
MLLIKNGREAHLAKVCEKFEKDVLTYKGIIEAHIVSAVALSSSDKEKLVSKLSSQLKKEVLLTEEVDTSVIGGLKLEVEGYQLDNTISGKLRALRNAMID